MTAAAAAVASALALGAARAGASTAPGRPAGARRPPAPVPDGTSAEALLEILCAKLRAQRRRKRERRRAAQGGGDGALERQAMEVDAAGPGSGAAQDSGLGDLAGAGSGKPAPPAAVQLEPGAARPRMRPRKPRDPARGVVQKTLKSGAAALRELSTARGRTSHDADDYSEHSQRTKSTDSDRSSIGTRMSALPPQPDGENSNGTSRPPGSGGQ